MNTPHDRAVDIATAVRDAGGRALVVGGWVRDRLLGHESPDIDIEVFGMESPASPGFETAGRVRGL